MKKDSQRRRAAKDDVAARGDRTGRTACPVIVVGIGVPADGLKSLKQLFARMPSGHGVAFVIVQHVESSQKNLPLKQLKDQTGMPMVEAADGMEVLADRIHVMPPDKFLSLSRCRLTFQEPVYCDGLRMPIDHFFCSLAADQGRRCCGIVLSGTGSDGTLGLSEIKAAGGTTLVEDPGSVKFPGMPQSAIDPAVVDAVLQAGAMVEPIVALSKQVVEDTRNEPAESPEFDANLRAVLDLLRAKVGHDFRCYKPTTLVRRIRRRMTLAKVATFAEYARFLHEHPEEVGLLQKDLLIGVTEFFRQPQAWEILEEKVIAGLVEKAQPGSEIRVWVPGCSTGNEAYSLAMVLTEQVEQSRKKVSIQIFATDSDVASLATARSGIYSREEIRENVSPERLKRFFTRKDGLYRVIKEVRERIVFAPQNITADPPFSRLDLISCRNLLIYLDQQVQQKIIALFHFALREGGFLFLGTAETVGEREDLFEPVSKKWRIYRRIGVGRPVGVEIPVRPTVESLPAGDRGVATGGKDVPPGRLYPHRLSLTSMAQQMLLDRFAPACVMIDRKLQVLYVHGAVENYLTFPSGELTTRVVDMAREGLRARLRGAIDQCIERNRSVSVTARVRRGEKSMPVKATATPLRYPRETDGLLLIAFEDYRAPAVKAGRQTAGKSDVHQLEDELKVTREELQSTIDQLENSNDQLKASNEEVTAANEELQSANEELETSKEELQSLNEELNTINTRLQEKVGELEDTNNDIVNLLSSTSIATVFLDKESRVKRYTPASASLFSLISTDVGRPIADIRRRFSDEALLEDARRVLADLTSLSKEVQTEDGRWYIRRITPYRTQDDRIEGVVVTFVDVCDLKQTEEVLRRQKMELETARAETENEKRRLEAVMEALPVGVAIRDARGGNIKSNSAFERVWGEPRPPTDSVSDYEAYKAWWANTGRAVAPEEWASARVLQNGESVVGQVLEIERFDGSHAFVINSASPVRDAAGSVIGTAVAIQDITDLRKAEKGLQDSETRLRLFIDNVPVGVIRWTMDGKVQDANDPFLQMVGYSRDDLLEGRINWLEMTPPEFHERDREATDELKATGRNVPYEKAYIRKDGSRLPILLSSVMIDPAYSWEGLAFVLDIAESKLAEEALGESRRRLAGIVDSIADGFFAFDKEWRITHMNDAALRHYNKTHAEVVGRSFLEVFPTAAGSIFEAQYRHAMETGKPVHFEAPSTVTDRMLEVHAYPGPDNITVLFRDITERKRMAEALREAHDRAAWLARFPEENPNPVMRVSADGSVLYRNPAVAELSGWACEVGQPLANPLLPLVGRAMTEGRETQDEVELGGRFYFVSVVPIVAEGYANVYGRDITERKRVEEAILRAKEEWERTFDAVPDLVAILDAQHRILRVNRAMGDRLGMSPDRCIGLRCHDAVHGTPNVPGFCPHVLTCDDSQQHVAEVHEPRLGGDFLVSTTPLCDPQGRLIGSVHVARDITERKRAEESLRQRTLELQRLTETLEQRVRERTAELTKTNEALRDEMAQRMRAEEAVKGERQRFYDVLETLPVYVVLLTPDYHVPFANRFFRERFGESQGRQCFHYLFGRTEPCEICETFTVLKTHAPHHWEWNGPDGRNYDIHDFPFTDADGSPLIMEMGIDITERKRAEEQLKESTKQLRDLSSRLLSAQEEERKRIAGEIHDTLGASLSAIKFKVENSLSQIETSAPGFQSLQSIRPVIQESIEECRRMQMDLRPSMLDDLGLLPTLSWFLRRFQTIYSEIQIEREIEIEEGDMPPSLKVVIFRVTQEAMNNAAKHSHAKLVRLSLRRIEDGIELVLQDNGRGFDLEKARLQDPTKKGLGLTSMKERTELSGGSFAVESAEGKGTTLRAWWPLRRE